MRLLLVLFSIVLCMHTYAFDYTFKNVTFKCKEVGGSSVKIVSWDRSAKIVVVPGKVNDTKGKEYDVAEIDVYSSGDNYMAEELILSEGVREISRSCFLEFRKLRKVTLSTTLTVIGKRAFGNAKDNCKFEVPDDRTIRLLVGSGVDYRQVSQNKQNETQDSSNDFYDPFGFFAKKLNDADIDILGIHIREIGEFEGLPTKYGLMVTKVYDGLFKKYGVPTNFIIVYVNDERMKTIDDLKKAVNAANNVKDPVLMLQGLYPKGKKGYFAIPLESAPASTPAPAPTPEPAPVPHYETLVVEVVSLKDAGFIPGNSKDYRDHLDSHGEPCAMLRVDVAKYKLSYDSNDIPNPQTSNIKYNDKGYDKIWMVDGAKSLRVYSDKKEFESYTIVFKNANKQIEKLESGHAYDIKLRVVPLK